MNHQRRQRSHRPDDNDDADIIRMDDLLLSARRSSDSPSRNAAPVITTNTNTTKATQDIIFVPSPDTPTRPPVIYDPHSHPQEEQETLKAAAALLEDSSIPSSIISHSIRAATSRHERLYPALSHSLQPAREGRWDDADEAILTPPPPPPPPNSTPPPPSTNSQRSWHTTTTNHNHSSIHSQESSNSPSPSIWSKISQVEDRHKQLRSRLHRLRRRGGSEDTAEGGGDEEESVLMPPTTQVFVSSTGATANRGEEDPRPPPPPPPVTTTSAPTRSPRRSRQSLEDSPSMEQVKEQERQGRRQQQDANNIVNTTTTTTLSEDKEVLQRRRRQRQELQQAQDLAAKQQEDVNRSLTPRQRRRKQPQSSSSSQQQSQQQHEGSSSSSRRRRGQQTQHQETQNPDEEEHRPGAFSVDGPVTRASRRNRSISPSGQYYNDDDDDDDEDNINEDARRLRGGAAVVPASNTTTTRSSDAFRSSAAVVAVTTAMVVDDVLTEKEKQLQAQEALLAQRMLQLEAWEAELEKRKQQLDYSMGVGVGIAAPGPILPVPPVQTPQSLPGEQPPMVLEAQVMPAARARPRGLFDSIVRRGHPSSEAAHVAISEGEASHISNSDGGMSSNNTNVYQSHLVHEVSSSHGGGGDSHQSYGSTGPELMDPYLREQIERMLPPGQLRFSIARERPVEEQLRYLPTPDFRAYKTLVLRWQDHLAKTRSGGGGGWRGRKKKNSGGTELSPHWHLRFLRATAQKDGSFSVERAYQSEKKLKMRFVLLNSYGLGNQLRSQTLFPVPGLKTAGGHSMFYMRPSRYFPKYTTTKAVIDNLTYVMNCMLECEHAQQEGIGFIACMDEWKMQNFEVNYCYQFMMGLQSAMVPVKVELFMIVNPPTWFRAIWKIMKPMLAPAFRKKVKICPETKIPKYLSPDYRKYLPDDMKSGTVDTDQLVHDFIAYRQAVERDLPASRYYHDASGGFRHRTLGDLDDAGFFGASTHHTNDDASSDRTSSRPGFLAYSSSGGSRRNVMAGAGEAMWDTHSSSAGSRDQMDRFGGYMESEDDDLASIDGSLDIDDETLMEEEDTKQPALRR